MTFTNCKRGRLVAAFGELFLIELENSMEIKKAVLSGKLKHTVIKNENLPSVGDYVLVRPNEFQGPWTITDVVDRKNVLKRKMDNAEGAQVLGVNLDAIFIVSSLNQDLNFKRIDRYLMIAREAELQPILLFTKKDLVALQVFLELEEKINQRFPHLTKIFTSMNELTSVEFLKETFKDYLIPHWTWVLIGSSGVGKSTFINAFLDDKKIITREIRENDDKGRHTTTHRELHHSFLGVTILDSPGIRELEGIGHEVHEDFKHIEKLASSCKYRNCRHLKDPGCALEEALENEEISEDELQSFLKLYNKESFDLRKMNPEEKNRVRDGWKKRAIRNRKDQKISRHLLNGRY